MSHKITVADFSADMVRAAALKCPINLGHGKGPVRVDASTGDWFAYPARSEPVRRYWKACKHDLLQRQLRGGSYEGDVGHCVIGGKRFSLYPKSAMLVRDDFALWCEAHVKEFWNVGTDEEKLPEAPSGPEIEIDPQLKIWKDIRARALKLREPTGLLHPESFNSMFEMKHALAEYALEIRRDEANGRFFVSTKILADQLAATIAYREKHYADAMSFFLDCAAAALRAALHIQDTFGKKGAADGEG